MSRRGRALAIAAALCVVLVVVVVATRGGGTDGPAAFLSHEAEEALFVQWTRVGADVSGTLLATDVAQQQEGWFAAAANPPAGQVVQQSMPFTGTVRDGSVRLLIGSGALSTRINGRLDGDTLKLTVPQDTGVQNMQLKAASRADYTDAVQDIRDHVKQRKAAAQAARARARRIARPAITAVATAFQKAMNPTSADDPCRYVTTEFKQDILDAGDVDPQTGFGRPGGSCAKILRDYQRSAIRYSDEPLYKGPQGVASIEFTDSLPKFGNGGPPGAIVTWSPASGRGSPDASLAHFTKQNGQWRVYKCCHV